MGVITVTLIICFTYWITGYIHKQSIIIQEQYSRLAGQASLYKYSVNKSL